MSATRESRLVNTQEIELLRRKVHTKTAQFHKMYATNRSYEPYVMFHLIHYVFHSLKPSFLAHLDPSDEGSVLSPRVPSFAGKNLCSNCQVSFYWSRLTVLSANHKAPNKRNAKAPPGSKFLFNCKIRNTFYCSLVELADNISRKYLISLSLLKLKRGRPLDIQEGGGLGRSGDKKSFISCQSGAKIYFFFHIFCNEIYTLTTTITFPIIHALA